MSEKALPPLDLTAPASQVAERWRKWKRAFEYFAECKGIDNVRKKTSLLLCIGQIEASTYPPGHTPSIWHLCRPGEEGIWLSESSGGGNLIPMP